MLSYEVQQPLERSNEAPLAGPVRCPPRVLLLSQEYPSLLAL
jgi:hypothetical protein